VVLHPRTSAQISEHYDHSVHVMSAPIS